MGRLEKLKKLSVFVSDIYRELFFITDESRIRGKVNETNKQLIPQMKAALTP